MDKHSIRLRRARKTRIRISDLQIMRLCIFRSNSHIYAQIISHNGAEVLASASSLERDVRDHLRTGGNISAASLIGKRIADKAKVLGISKVAFDRSGFQYHGRVKALAEAARENGLEF